MRLLQRTIRLYSILSLCVLLIGIPFFYILLRSVVKEEVDEELLVNKSQIAQRLKRMGNHADPKQFTFLDHDVAVEPNAGRAARISDSFSTVARYDSAVDEVIEMRVLKTIVNVNEKSYQITLQAPMVDYTDLIQTILLVQIALIAALFIGLWAINRNVSSAYLLQKEFTENAAHEMQTPLAVMQSKLELLMQTSPISPEQAHLIGKMADAGQRMNKLNKGLVLLTRIENHQFTDREKVNPAGVVHSVLNQYEDAIAEKNITVSVKNVSPVKIDANRTLIDILIGNLLSNAIRHNQPNGSINISLIDRELMVENTGVSQPLNTTRLFQRFAKDSSSVESLGLGLQIVDQICVLSHYSLKYRFISQRHNFTVRF